MDKNLNLKLIDFGTVQLMEDNKNSVSLKKSIEDQINMFMFEYNKKVKKKISYQNETQEVGTKYYLPPEFIELRESSPMWDWWSFGVIIRNYFVSINY